MKCLCIKDGFTDGGKQFAYKGKSYEYIGEGTHMQLKTEGMDDFKHYIGDMKWFNKYFTLAPKNLMDLVMI